MLSVLLNKYDTQQLHGVRNKKHHKTSHDEGDDTCADEFSELPDTILELLQTLCLGDYKSICEAHWILGLHLTLAASFNKDNFYTVIISFQQESDNHIFLIGVTLVKIPDCLCVPLSVLLKLPGEKDNIQVLVIVIKKE